MTEIITITLMNISETLLSMNAVPLPQIQVKATSIKGKRGKHQDSEKLPSFQMEGSEEEN